MLDAGAELDSVFSRLKKDFGIDEVNRQIFEALGEKRPRTLKHHRDILRLSRNAQGTHRLVTTNFDLLFEKADRRLKRVVPPVLPNLELEEDIDGLVYLHGRLEKPGSASVPNYVIGSADFGRAYLAEGWAAQFVRSIREKYTVVLLGYSADDPPMRYLLEGLNSRQNVTYEHPLYAFTSADGEEARELWADRGVTPIFYSNSDGHRALWDTISAWADADEDPEKWARQRIELARSRPSKLQPFERGQVANLLMERDGAKAFANAVPSISPEWLAVFDPFVRYSEPWKERWGDDDDEFDPQTLYGLDDDAPRPDNSENRVVPASAANPLEAIAGERDLVGGQSLVGHGWLTRRTLPERLWHISRWIALQCHDPFTVWWSSGWKKLHPELLSQITDRLRSKSVQEFHKIPSLYWQLYAEQAEWSPPFERNFAWYEFEGFVRQSGWTNSSLRFLGRILQPVVLAKRPFRAPPTKLSKSWEELPMRRVADLEATPLSHHGQEVRVPDEHIAEVVRLYRRALENLSDLMDEIGELFWNAPSLSPSDRTGQIYHDDKAQFFIVFRDLLEQLIVANRKAAKREIDHWSKDEGRFFPVLTLWAATRADFLSAREAYKSFARVKKSLANNSYAQRDLLLFLRNRWSQFSLRERQLIERWIIQEGTSRRGDKNEYVLRRGANAAAKLFWLESNGCEISKTTKRRVEGLIKSNQYWSERWIQTAADSLGPRGGMIAEVTESKGLESLPIRSIVREAQVLSVEKFDELSHYYPFRGLTENFPFKALASLRIAMRKGEVPYSLWRDLLLSWPEETSLRQDSLLAHSIGSLPEKEALELRYYTTDWIKERLCRLYRADRRNALRVFDAVLLPFERAAPTDVSSSLGKTTIGGVVQPGSEVSVNKALNSPIGKLTEALWSILPDKARKYGRPNRDIRNRLERMLKIAGPGSGHMVASLTKRAGWIAYCYDTWFAEFILPLFSVKNDQAEAAWNGLAYNRNSLPRNILSSLSSDWLAILRGEVDWVTGREQKRVLTQTLVWLSDPNIERGAIFDFDQVREVIKGLDAEGRGHVLWALSNAAQESAKWDTFIKPFLLSAWPRQLRYRGEEVTRELVRIVTKAKDHFADAVETVLPLLRPIGVSSFLAYDIAKGEADTYLKYPLHSLMLLNATVGDDRAQLPHNLSAALKILSDKDKRLVERAEFKRLLKLSA